MANDIVNNSGAPVLDDTQQPMQVAGIPEVMGAVVKGVGEVYQKIPPAYRPIAVGVGLPAATATAIVVPKIAISEATSDHDHLNIDQCKAIAAHVRQNLEAQQKAWAGSPESFPGRFNSQPSCESDKKALEATYGPDAIKPSER